MTIKHKLTGFFLMIGLLSPLFAGQILSVAETLTTSGAREVTPFKLNHEQFLAVAQLAEDIPDTPANMNGGNSDIAVVIFKKQSGGYKEYQRIPSHGNESVEFFTIDNNAFLAVASIRSGPHAPYNMNTYSKLYRWDGHYFYPVQQFFTFAAKQWHYFTIGNRRFLAVANGVTAGEANTRDANTNSMVYEWDGRQFKPFQSIPSQWAYSFETFNMDGQHYLALADHLKQSSLYRWNGQQFISVQLFKGNGGRAFKFFTIADKHYLAYANISNDSVVYKWNGRQFVSYQTLKGAGGRNFAFFTRNGHYYLLRINFILGDRTNPETSLSSPLYEWKKDRFMVVETIPTFGGVSAALFANAGQTFIAVANSLSADRRFRVDSVIYRINTTAKSGSHSNPGKP
ncbi:hypothetical protein [Legionella spiritensis]|uniref:EPTP domain protein n=1 Tax=Legionella spiritensis TaxID=452 RepID=A0A0W0Z6N3_LEGSP|nr:hypothetical protein [Legionella spiritensis]KTD64764.1 EPTP domain protein [Legionella spiritensis]SNV48269.1 EPTP domain [Legionella spiritensis]